MRGICATATGCQMNKQLEVYYLEISHLLSDTLLGFNSITAMLAEQPWAWPRRLGVCEGKKRGCIYGLG